MYRDYAINKLASGAGFVDSINSIGRASKKIVKSPAVKKIEDEIKAKRALNRDLNDQRNFTQARDNLKSRTGRETFSMDEIIKEVAKIKKSKDYKIKV